MAFGICLVCCSCSTVTQPTAGLAPVMDRPTRLLRQQLQRNDIEPVTATISDSGGPSDVTSTAYGCELEACGPESCAIVPNCEAHRRPTRGPRDEYLCDGGDREWKVAVDKDWNISGLDLEDTIAHYDTLDGHVEVAASNRVCLYAPRFSAARSVTGVLSNDVQVFAGNMIEKASANEFDDPRLVSAVTQPIATVRQIQDTIVQAVQEHQKGLTADWADEPNEAVHGLLPIENLEIVQTGTAEESQMSSLIEAMDTALVWQDNVALQVTIDRNPGVIRKSVTGANELTIYENKHGSRVRVVKLASAKSAKSGDVIDFTIRFDNVGEQAVGNVTLIDNLTTRLEYVEESQVCSIEADFFSAPNDGQSRTLRWEITEPLEPTDGGVIRFKCRVR